LFLFPYNPSHFVFPSEARDPSLSLRVTIHRLQRSSG